MSHNLIKVGLETSLSITGTQENRKTVLSSLLICTNSQRRTQIDFPSMLHLICHSPITPKWVRASINKACLLWVSPSICGLEPNQEEMTSCWVIVLPGNSEFSNTVSTFCCGHLALFRRSGREILHGLFPQKALCAVYTHLLCVREKFHSTCML